MRGNTNPFPSSEFALLGLLYERPTHGYDLHKLITDPDGIGMIWGVKMSNLYAQLDKLENKQLISGVLQPGESRPARTQYQITPEGKRLFEAWLTMEVKHPREFRHEFMLHYYFLMRLLPGQVIDYCEKQHSECIRWLENTLAANQKVEENVQFKKAVMQFRVAQIQSMVNWLTLLSQNPRSDLRRL
jgi:DNA-binding PadR family transcriptional regulator